MSASVSELVYVHDPMCSWCWGFRPVWQRLQEKLPRDLKVRRLLGGLAPDTQEPMPLSMQRDIASYWKVIQQRIPGTEFNFDFWEVAKPRRSTYPACRSVIAAKFQGAEERMIKAVQEAYYLRALNPSDDDVHLMLAGEIGLDVSRFADDLVDPMTQKVLRNEISEARVIGGNSFPSLFLIRENHVLPVPIDYNDSAPMLQCIIGNL